MDRWMRCVEAIANPIHVDVVRWLAHNGNCFRMTVFTNNSNTILWDVPTYFLQYNSDGTNVIQSAIATFSPAEDNSTS